jgi:hypothetical protein
MGAIVPYAKQAVRRLADGLFVFPEPGVAASLFSSSLRSIHPMEGWCPSPVTGVAVSLHPCMFYNEPSSVM